MIKQKAKARLDIGSLQAIALIIALTGLIAAFTLQVMGETRDDMGEDDCAARSDSFTSYNSTSKLCYNSSGSTVAVGTAQFNATGEGIDAVGTIPEKLPIIVTVIVAAIIIGVLVSYFGGKKR